jgi:AraC family transcriptional regulator of adaptative response/methylated-DNA-[protein]-cysteine methyltransferase
MLVEQRASKPASERQRQAVTRACRLIEAADVLPDLDRLAAAAGLSRFHFHRVFKRLTGVTPKAYAAGLRAARVRDGLERGESVTAAMYGAGFNSSGRFYAESAARLGMQPSAARRGGAGETIRFAVGQCSLGAVLVAATGRGLCTIALGDDAGALLRALQDRFPKAELAGGDPRFEEWVARVVGLIEQPARGLDADLPLDIRGTAFQVKVWDALRGIPPGSTASYAEIARRIGRPGASRAVAAACAANPLAVAIPCHRVVRTDASLSGYRWGAARKAALLARERGATSAGAAS